MNTCHSLTVGSLTYPASYPVKKYMTANDNAHPEKQNDRRNPNSFSTCALPTEVNCNYSFVAKNSIIKNNGIIKY